MENYIAELFEKVDIGRSISFDGEDLCNTSDYLLLELSGGIPVKQLEFIRLEISVTASCVYEVDVTTDLYSTARTINFKTREISNYLMRVLKTQCGIGSNLFINQIISARKYDFKEIVTSAQSGSDYKGYYTWGRLGYTMNQTYQEKLDMWCFENEIEPTSLFNLLKDENHKAKWIKSGFTWLGAFDLQGESENILILKEYLEIKGRLGNFSEFF